MIYDLGLKITNYELRVERPVFDFSVIETERLLLRKYSFSDIDAVFEMYNDSVAMKYTGPDKHSTIEDSEKFLRNVLSEHEKEKSIFWAIVQKENNKLVGDISLSGIDYKHCYATFGFFLSRNFWDQGLMSETVPHVLRFAFENLHLNRIEAQVSVFNFPTIRILEKNGFLKEGVQKENFLVEGKLTDSFLFAILRSETTNHKPQTTN